MKPLPANPLATIVTPSYNQGRFIRATIESVLSQDYPRVEYLIMDGGSTDETASVVRDYASRLTFVSECDRGQSHAINKGFRSGRGEVLAWLNSDDLYLPGAISTAVRALVNHSVSGMVYGEGYVIDRDGNSQGRFPHSRPFELWRLAYLSDYILQQSSYFRRDTLDDVGYLDEGLHYGMDWDLFIRIGMKYPVLYIPEYLGCIRQYAEAKSSRGAMVRARELHALLRKHTGMWLPPGSIVYGGDTCFRLLKAWLERHAPPGLESITRVAGIALGVLFGAAIGRTLEHSQHRYADGWCGNRLRFMLPAGSGLFVVRGSIPHWAKPLHGQQVAIRANGRPLGRFPAPVGKFEIPVLAPPELDGRPLRLHIAASRSFRSATWRGDRRRVAFLLEDICWV